jgi:hypothetical protein
MEANHLDFEWKRKAKSTKLIENTEFRNVEIIDQTDSAKSTEFYRGKSDLPIDYLSFLISLELRRFPATN